MIAIRKKTINHCMGIILNRVTAASGFYLLAIIVTLMLSAWQFQRGLTAFEQQKLESIRENNILQGRWLSERVLLDNRTLKGAAGYWVFAPLLMLNNQVRWVRIGFYSTQDRDKIVLPALPDEVSVEVEVSTIPWITPLVWGDNHLELIDDLTWRTQEFSSRMLNQLSNTIWADKNIFSTSQAALYALMIVPGGYKRPEINKPYLQPYTHFGYAFQWFGLAVAAAIFMVRFMKKSDRD
jgi:cytochrome oxidase assembly protein ShyY1